MIYYSEAVNTADNDRQYLAIECVPTQESDFGESLFSFEDALIKGTVFPELYLPFCAEGGAR